MAWVDDRIWCHPKFTDLSAPAFRAYIQGVAYSCGMNTRGHLSGEQQRLVGGSPKVRSELEKAGLWDANPSGGIDIHDWDEHNGKRDERRAADRERKRLARAKERDGQARTSARPSRGTSAGQSAGRSTLAARVDGSDRVTDEEPRAVKSRSNPDDDEPRITPGANGPGKAQHLQAQVTASLRTL